MAWSGRIKKGAIQASALPRVVIVGAGFGGLAAAKRLVAEHVDLTIVDRQNHHLFQPLLYQVATAALSPADIATPIRSILRPRKDGKVRVLLDEVIGVDTSSRRIETRDSAPQSYDYLVLATGSTYSYFGHNEWGAAAPGLKTIEDARRIRMKLLGAFERAETTEDRHARARLMTFVLIGGGPTGVEMAGAVAELARATLARDFQNIDPTTARIILVEAGPRLLPTFPEDQGRYSEDALSRLGVTVMTNSPVQSIDADGVIVCDRPIEAATVIWCAGVQASPVAAWLRAKQGRSGTVEVKQNFEVPGVPNVFVVGDSAAWRDETGRALPGLAPVAKQEGAYVGSVIAARLSSRQEPPPFRYRDWGTMATIGRSAAVGLFGRLHVRGFIAWILWGAVHLAYLIGFRNRAAVLIDWVWAWATYGRGARLIADMPLGREAQPISQGHCFPERNATQSGFKP